MLKLIKTIFHVKNPLHEDMFLDLLVYLNLVVQGPLALYFIKFLMPDWQQPGFEGIYSTFVGSSTLHFLYPFFAFSILSAPLYHLNPVRYASSLLVHAGVYTGTFLAILLTILFFVARIESDLKSGPDGFNFIYLFGMCLVSFLINFFYLAKLYLIFSYRHKKKTVIMYTFLVYYLPAIFLLNAAPLVFFMYILSIPFSIIFTGILLIIKFREQGTVHMLKSKLLFSFVYMSTFLIALRFAIERTFYVYSKLPKNAPSCFIVTAASNGHYILTRPKYIYSESKGPYILTSQIINFKAAELVLKAVFPKFHSILRNWYDFYGKKAASKISNPYVSDVVFLLLMPFSVCIGMLLKLIFPGYKKYIE